MRNVDSSTDTHANTFFRIILKPSAWLPIIIYFVLKNTYPFDLGICTGTLQIRSATSTSNATSNVHVEPKSEGVTANVYGGQTGPTSSKIASLPYVIGIFQKQYLSLFNSSNRSTRLKAVIAVLSGNYASVFSAFEQTN